MEITKPSELREGMKLKGKWLGIPVSGVACTANNEIWFLMPHMARLTELFNQAMSAEFTDLESVEGLMAAKEGDVLVDDDGDEYVIVFANDFIVLLSEHDEIFTWQDIEDREWKLKDQEQPSESPAIITSNELEIQRKVFTEIEDELLKHKFTTDMSGWEIVPQLMATMQILRSKYFGGKSGEITSWVNAGEYDYDFDYSIGNCFKTEEEAEEALKTGWIAYLQALKRLKNYIAEYGLEFEPDWDDTCAKHFIVYEHNTRLFSSDRYGVGFRQASSLPYFETENDAEQVIRDCEPELKILFGVK